ncbi:MAG: glycosyltransferase family 4 protein [Chlorobiaceae bacterium]|nr:glycosyltransferase family 4 protein [Chlorobiaceae bacterium]NTW73718.1 glycosyltransferase family 4 protein [Chlorobiaceae bacterium]
MKILIVSSGDFFSTFGGGQIYVKNLVDELIGRGADIVIAMPVSIDGRTTATAQYRGVPVHVYDPSAIGQGKGSPGSLLRLVKPDVVHVHGDKAAFAIACHEAGTPCVVTVHHGGILCPAGALLNHQDRICRVAASDRECLPCVLKNVRGGIVSWYLFRYIPTGVLIGAANLMLRLPFVIYFTPVVTAALSIRNTLDAWAAISSYATLLVSPSQAMAECLVRNGAKPEQVKVLSHGIPLPNALAVADAARSGKVRFYFVGRICHVKGVHRLVEAFSGISAGSAELHIVGEPSSHAEHRYQDRLKQTCRDDPRVFWHGKIENDRLYELTKGYDVMVHPTICLEVFGLNIAEALAAGKPVIATRSGGPEMQIRDGVNGFLVDPDSALALRGAMERCIEEPELVAGMKAVAASGVVSMQEHVEDLLKMIDKAIRRHGA